MFIVCSGLPKLYQVPKPRSGRKISEGLSDAATPRDSSTIETEYTENNARTYLFKCKTILKAALGFGRQLEVDSWAAVKVSLLGLCLKIRLGFTGRSVNPPPLACKTSSRMPSTTATGLWS